MNVPTDPNLLDAWTLFVWTFLLLVHCLHTANEGIHLFTYSYGMRINPDKLERIESGQTCDPAQTCSMNGPPPRQAISPAIYVLPGSPTKNKWRAYGDALSRHQEKAHSPEKLHLPPECWVMIPMS